MPASSPDMIAYCDKSFQPAITLSKSTPARWQAA